MNNTLQMFQNEQFGSIRAVIVNNEPWLVGKDVALALGYAKPENAISAHVDAEDKTITLIQGSGSNYKTNTTIINESGLYSLILSSKLPSAKKFKRWVTREVLPAIRKSGMYKGGGQESHTAQIEGLTKCIEGLTACIRTLSGQVKRLEQVDQADRLELPQRTIEPLPVSTTAQLLLRTLQDLERAIPYAFGEVQISNRRLCQLLSIRSNHTLTAARRELMDAGYITVSSGVKSKPCIYQIKKR